MKALSGRIRVLSGMPSTLFGICCTLAIASSVSAQEADNAMLKYGLSFLKTPYVAHTLEVNDEEKLVVNFDEVDCTTFVEYVLALSLSPVKDGAIDKADYARNLKNIRYRDGKIEGYTSRLHYIADWVNNGVRHGFMEDVAAANSPDTVRLSLDFMSTHAKAYKHLESSPANIGKMEEIEKSLSGHVFHYIPKNKLPDNGFGWIKNGDIIAITTNIPGLDVVHLGLAYYERGVLKLLHASSTRKMVVVTQRPLAQMLKNNKKFTGIRVLRMKKDGQ